MEDDALDFVMAVLRARLANGAGELVAIESELRAALGGQRHYIRSRTREGRRPQVLAAHAAGASVAQLVQRFGYSPRHIRRLLTGQK